MFALIVSAGYLLLSGLENQILVPRIMGNAVNLPPVVVLIGVIVGGSTLGIAGIFLAVPVMATGKEVFLYLYGKVLETEEDLPQPETKEEANRSFREFLQSTTTRIRGWFSRGKNSQPNKNRTYYARTTHRMSQAVHYPLEPSHERLAGGADARLYTVWRTSGFHHCSGHVVLRDLFVLSTIGFSGDGDR